MSQLQRRVTAQQFHGYDINEFAVELAKVSLMIAKKLAVDEFDTDEEPLPLDNLDGNMPYLTNGSISTLASAIHHIWDVNGARNTNRIYKRCTAARGAWPS